MVLLGGAVSEIKVFTFLASWPLKIVASLGRELMVSEKLTVLVLISLQLPLTMLGII